MKIRRVGTPKGWIVALAALLPALLCSCGGTGGGQGGAQSGAVSASLVWERPSSSAVASSGAAPRVSTRAVDACTEYGIQSVKMTVLNGSQVLATGTFACSAHEGTLAAVPAGSNYTLLFEGLNAGGQSTWTSLYTGVSVGGGQTVRYDNVVMRYAGADRTAPSVLDMTPKEGSQTAPRLDTITIAFDEMLRPSTVNDNTIRLLEFGTDNAVAGTVGYDAATFTATFLPNLPLTPLTLYYVKTGKGITDLAGNPLGSAPPVDNVGTDYASESFLTQAAGPSVTVLPATSVTSATAVLNGRVNPLGESTTAYFQYGTDVRFLGVPQETAHQSIGAGSAPVPVSASVTGLQNNTAYFFRLVANTTTSNAWKFTSTSGWSAPVLAERLATIRSMYPKIAVDNAGNVLNIFVTDPDIADAYESSPRLYTNRYFAGSGTWGSARNLETDFSEMVQGLEYQLALDAAGNGFAAWLHRNSSSLEYGISVARFDSPTGTWSAPVRFLQNPSFYVWRVGTPFLKVTPAGKAILVFEYSDEPNTGYKYTFYEPGTGWLPLADLIPLAPGNSSILNDLAYDAMNDRFVALWATSSGAFPPDVSVTARNIPLPVGGVIQPMGAPVILQVDNGVMSGGSGGIGFDNNGWAFAVWAKSYDPGGGGAFVEKVYIGQYPGSWYVQELPGAGSVINGGVERIRLEVNPSGDAIILLRDNGRLGDTPPVSPQVHTYHYDFTNTQVWIYDYGLNTNNPLCSPFLIYGAQTSFAFDENRNGMFVYKTSGTGGTNICANRFTRGEGSGTGWGTATVLNGSDRVNVHYPFIAPTGNGGGFVTIWFQSDGTWEHLYESRFQQ